MDTRKTLQVIDGFNAIGGCGLLFRNAIVSPGAALVAAEVGWIARLCMKLHTCRHQADGDGVGDIQGDAAVKRSVKF